MLDRTNNETTFYKSNPTIKVAITLEATLAKVEDELVTVMHNQ